MFRQIRQLNANRWTLFASCWSSTCNDAVLLTTSSFTFILTKRLELKSRVQSPMLRTAALLLKLGPAEGRTPSMFPKSQGQVRSTPRERLGMSIAIMCYKILNNLVDLDCSDFFVFANSNRTRGHSCKLFTQQCSLDVRKYCFANRVVEPWNHLPDHVVRASSVSLFRKLIDTVDLSGYCRY